MVIEEDMTIIVYKQMTNITNIDVNKLMGKDQSKLAEVRICVH